MEAFTVRVIQLIQAIPAGSVATYGQIARLSGSPGAARQVVRILVSCSRKEDLPWHRVVGSPCHIALPKGGGYEYQEALLQAEGVDVADDGTIDENLYRWDGS